MFGYITDWTLEACLWNAGGRLPREDNCLTPIVDETVRNRGHTSILVACMAKMSILFHDTHAEYRMLFLRRHFLPTNCGERLQLQGGTTI